MRPAGNPVDADQWRSVRRYLNGHRHELAQRAARLYPGLTRVGPTGLLSRSSWLPDRPLDLGQIALSWESGAEPPAVTGREAAAAGVLPLDARGRRFASYAEAMEALDRPALFEDRPCYRLLRLRADGSGADRARGQMTFGAASYFDGVSVSEAVGHELAGVASGTSPPGLPLRSAVGDPTDLTARAALTAISVLTLRSDRRAGTARFVLHWRDPARVTHAGGLYQVMPVGVFQPSAAGPAARAADFDLWRCIVREYSEEFLGGSEDYGDGTAPFDYAGWPLYRALTTARADGRLRAYYLGAGVDPLSFANDLLVVTVIDAGLFDDVFGSLVDRNDEGVVLTGADRGGFAFDEPTVRDLAGHQPLQAAGAAVLDLAWRFRDHLLGATPG